MSRDAPSVAWNLCCPWCGWYIVVNARGMRGEDMGSGVEAAQAMRAHVEFSHKKTWLEYLTALD